jgi:hypothetical protein
MTMSVAPGRTTARHRAQEFAIRAYAIIEAQPLWLLALAVAALVGLIDYAKDPGALLRTLGDTDDATRLTQVRELIAGQPWFDMTLRRFGGADALVSHWSRLIDLPLAVLMLLFTSILGPGGAELAVRVAWPVILDAAVAYAIARFCFSFGGRAAALLAIVIVMPSTGHFQYSLGRIDHHNAMIIGAVGGSLMLALAIDRPRFGWLAGILLGLGCAVGLEGLALTAASLAIVTLAVIAGGGSLAGVTRAAVSFAATLAFAYLAFGPGRPDGLMVCDALSVNLVALTSLAGCGVGLGHLARSQGASRLAVLCFAAFGAACGLAAYGATQPVCLAGPYAQVEPRLWGLWLNHVSEVRPLFSMILADPIDGLLLAGYPLVGLAYAVLVVPRRDMARGELLIVIFAASVLLGCWQIRLMPYASYLAVPFMVAGVLHTLREPRGAGQRELRLPQMPAHAVPAAIAACLVGVGAFLAWGGPVAATQAEPVMPVVQPRSGHAACTSSEAVSALSRLPAGLAANDLDLGPYLVAATRLDVMSAPYHRMGRSIIVVHELFHGSVTVGAAQMRAAGATYIVLCPGLGVTFADRPAVADGLRFELMAGRTPAFLEAVPVEGTPIRVWRLKPPG